MNYQIRRGLEKIMFTIANKYGYKFSKSGKTLNKDNLISNVFELIVKTSFNPKTIIDIGAHKGGWTDITMKYFPESKYHLFEPQPLLAVQLNERYQSNERVFVHNCGVGRKSGDLLFTYVDRADSCNFRISQEEAEVRGLRQELIPVVSIDSLITNGEIDLPDILKIDAEGLDLQVLQGSGSIIGLTEIILIEVGIRNKNIENGIVEVINFMNGTGYELFDLTDLNRPFENKILWLAELVFVKKNGIISTYHFN